MLQQLQSIIDLNTPIDIEDDIVTRNMSMTLKKKPSQNSHKRQIKTHRLVLCQHWYDVLACDGHLKHLKTGRFGTNL